MELPVIVDGTSAQAEAIVRWLKVEFASELSGGGFYHNRSSIRRAARNSEMKCLVAGRTVLGISVFTAGTSRYVIEILEIRPEFRGLGLGRVLAAGVIDMFLKRGAPHIEVQCAPRSSEGFWRELGLSANVAGLRRNPKLLLYS